jgi:hypothetical protein
MKNLKRIFFIALILIGSSVIDAYSSCIVTIKLARHRDCLGFGWCKLTITIEDDSPSANKCISNVAVNANGQLEFTINKKTGLTQSDYDKFFSKGTFLFEDDFPVPTDVLSAAGYKGSSLTIKAGTYPVITQGDNLKLTF